MVTQRSGVFVCAPLLLSRRLLVDFAVRESHLLSGSVAVGSGSEVVGSVSESVFGLRAAEEALPCGCVLGTWRRVQCLPGTVIVQCGMGGGTGAP